MNKFAIYADACCDLSQEIRDKYDIIYVKANDVKARQSMASGNETRSISFWLSLASVLTTIAVLVFK